MKLWPNDAKSFSEKAMYVAMYTLPALGYLFMLLSAFQLFKNDYSQAASETGAGLKILGLALGAGAVWQLLRLANDKVDVTIKQILIAWALLGLSLLFLAVGGL